MSIASGFTEQEKIEFVRQYLLSGTGYRTFCDNNSDLNINYRNFFRWVKKYKHIAEIEEGKLHNNHSVNGTSILYDSEGKVKLQWIKTKKEIEDSKEYLKDFVKELSADIPQEKPVTPPEIKNDNLMACYVLTDAHIGMRSEDWDLKTSEEIIKKWIDTASFKAQDAHTAVFCLQGDTSHFDSMKPMTPQSGHVLDADCNARQMNRLIIRLLRYCVKRLLEKHNHVHIIYASGNHDLYTAVIQSEWLSYYYENEPRVSVDTENTLYHAYEWGDVSVFFHHGHKRKLNDISYVFAGMYREMFGKTKYSYGHIGHFHHVASSENQIMQVEIHPTLSGKDDYAKEGGWMSQRGAQVITYHKKYGEFSRTTIRPEMLKNE